MDSDEVDYLYSLTPADSATDKMADLNYSETIDEIDELIAEEDYYTGSGATPLFREFDSQYPGGLLTKESAGNARRPSCQNARSERPD